MMYHKLLPVVSCCFLVIICTHCRPANRESTEQNVVKVNGVHDRCIAVKENCLSETGVLDKLQGVWFCYKYIKSDSAVSSGDEYKFDRYNENFAKEFSRYAYFTVSNDTLKGMDIYNTPIRIYKYDTKNQNHGGEEMPLLEIIQSVPDSLFFVSPVKPYEDYWENGEDLPAYTDAPLNKLKVLYDDNLIIYYRECFFFFKKDTTREKSTCYGVPGDEWNYFKVNIKYNTTDIKKVCDNFRRDYPYGGNLLLDYNDNESKIIHNDWSENRVLKVVNDSFASGKFVLKIVMGKATPVLYYFKDDDYDSDMEGYDDYQG